MAFITPPPAAAPAHPGGRPLLPDGAEAPGEQHAVTTSVFLHLAPGIAALAVYTIAAPVTGQWLALKLEILLAVVPLMLGWLVYRARRHGRSAWRHVVPYRNPLPLRQYAGFVPLLSLWAILVFVAVGAQSAAILLGTVFSWLPDWFVQPTDLTPYSRPALVALLIAEIAIVGIVAPIIEEVYFRGYLLPRLARFGGWAPVISTVLFAMYHFFSPWQVVGRVLAILPLTYVAWWKRNIVVGILVHCFLNILSTLLVFLPLLA